MTPILGIFAALSTIAVTGGVLLGWCCRVRADDTDEGRRVRRLLEQHWDLTRRLRRASERAEALAAENAELRRQVRTGGGRRQIGYFERMKRRG